MSSSGDFPEKKGNLIGLISQIHLWDIFHMSCESRLSLRVTLKAGQSDLSATNGASWSLYSHIHPHMNSHYWELFKMLRCFVWDYLDLIHKRKMAKSSISISEVIKAFPEPKESCGHTVSLARPHMIVPLSTPLTKSFAANGITQAVRLPIWRCCCSRFAHCDPLCLRYWESVQMSHGLKVNTTPMGVLALSLLILPSCVIKIIVTSL